MAEARAHDSTGETARAPSKAAGRGRIPAIDVLRGAVMVIMVLDHARDFFFGAQRIRPTDLAATTPALFFTRWVTHVCAPVFVFLAGTSAYLYGTRRSGPETSRFLLSRGLVLVLLEITVVRMCWFPDPFYRFTLLQVIWAIGWAMVLLAGAARLPWAVVLGLGVVIVGGHDLLSPVDAKDFGSLGFLWLFSFERGAFEPVAGHRIFVTYPIVPWFGVILLGFAFGKVMAMERPVRRVLARRIGLGMIVLFVVLRAVDRYGDPVPWTTQKNFLFTMMSFLNCEKYPPSLLYVLMTLGPALVVLSFLDREDRADSSALRRLGTLGGVPLFFYLAHLAILRFTSAPIAYARFGPSAFVPPPGHAGSPEFGLPAVYVAWVTVVLVLYAPSRWFLRKKEAHPGSVLRYF